MSEFETVYDEVLISATGKSLANPEVRAAHDTYVTETFESMLDDWTQTPPTANFGPLDDSNKTQIFQISHPNQADFTEDDLWKIARVRFLGRAILDSAKTNLTLNKAYKELEKEPGVAFDFLQAYEWYKEHPFAPMSPRGPKDADPDVPSPLALKDWPRGNYINCLGAAIASAAVAEMSGTSYLFGTEIRSSNVYVAQQHTEFMNRLKKAFPIFNEPNMKELLATLHSNFDGRFGEENKLYKNILHDSPPMLQAPDSGEIRDFHHFIVEKRETGEECTFVQVDPYGLIYAEHDIGNNSQLASHKMMGKRGESSVIVVDNSVDIAGVMMKYNQALRSCVAASKKIQNLCTQKNYKSENYFVDILPEIAAIIMPTVTILHPNMTKTVHDGFKGNLEHIVAISLLLATREHQLMQKAEEDAGDSKFFTTTYEIIEQYLPQLARAMRLDTPLQRTVSDWLGAAPIIYLLSNYAYDLQSEMNVRGGGSPDPALELAEPEFMIAAMYMNHYATHRKDGRINIARHLARLNPSQFLWQAARQDDFVDERVNAVGEIVKNLKPRQRHPLVNIASALPSPK